MPGGSATCISVATRSRASARAPCPVPRARVPIRVRAHVRVPVRVRVRVPSPGRNAKCPCGQARAFQHVALDYLQFGYIALPRRPSRLQHAASGLVALQASGVGTTPLSGITM